MSKFFEALASANKQYNELEAELAKRVEKCTCGAGAARTVPTCVDCSRNFALDERGLCRFCRD